MVDSLKSVINERKLNLYEFVIDTGLMGVVRAGTGSGTPAIGTEGDRGAE
jgi:hypothetical protein